MLRVEQMGKVKMINEEDVQMSVHEINPDALINQHDN
jgi:hypothetical protein